MGKNLMDYELQAATLIGAAGVPVQMGGVINIADYDTLTLYFTYVKGTEGGVDIYPVYHRRLGEPAYPYGEWTSAVGIKLFQRTYLRLTASGKYYVTYDVTGQNLVTIENVAVSGTATGTLAASVLMTGEGM